MGRISVKKKPIISRQGFPDYLASDDTKNGEAYGLQMGKAIEYQWFNRDDNQQCVFYDRKQVYHNLRLYARGEQSTEVYKNRLNNGEEVSYTNYDWRPLPIAPKFIKLLVNQMSERLYEVKAEATDKYSTDLKDKTKKMLEGLMLSREFFMEADKEFGVDLVPPGLDEIPDSQEEIDLYMSLKFKPALEIAAEEAIKYTLNSNDYEDIQSILLENIAVIGIAAVKHETDPSHGICVRSVDPADMVYAYPSTSNFDKVHYYGEVKRMTVNEFKRITGNKFTADEIKELAAGSIAWTNYQDQSNQLFYNEDDLDNIMIDVMDFTFKSTNTITYKKKNNRNGGYKLTQKPNTYDKKSENYDGYEVVRKEIDVWYEGSLVLGTNTIFNYGLAKNMIRTGGLIRKTMPKYIMYAPDLYRGVPRSLLNNMIQFIDDMQITSIKIQQMVAKARPNGIYIDITGFEEVPLGDGNFLTPLEMVKIYDETGNLLGSSQTVDSEYNYGREPVKELHNGVIANLNELIGAYNFYLNQLRDAVGIPPGADASTPHPDTAVGIQQQLALNSNTATRHVLNSVLIMTRELAKGIALRLSDVFKFSDLKEAYINAIGKTNMTILEVLREQSLQDVGLHIELKPDAKEQQDLENSIGFALKANQIGIDDVIDIRSIGNIKLANQLLKVRKAKKERADKAFELQKIDQQAQSNAKVAREVANAKMMEYDVKSKSEIAVKNVESANKIKEIAAEAAEKSRLMQQEFEYNMALAGLETKAGYGMEDLKHRNKVSLQDRGKSQESTLVSQRANNAPPVSFESSEDSISGSMNLGEMDV